MNALLLHKKLTLFLDPNNNQNVQSAVCAGSQSYVIGLLNEIIYFIFVVIIIIHTVCTPIHHRLTPLNTFPYRFAFYIFI